MEPAWIVMAAGTAAERTVPIEGRLHVGRECQGVDEHHRLLVDDAAVSRDHLEIRVEPRGAIVIDHSTNGTHVNGRRLERGEPAPLTDGDRIVLGAIELAFRAPTLPADALMVVDTTLRDAGPRQVAAVVGDVLGYTALTEAHGAVVLAAATSTLFGHLRGLVAEYGGTVSTYAGDAIFAIWEVDRMPDATAAAVRFALQADQLARTAAAALTVRDGTGGDLRMGWAVTLGEVAASRPSRGREAVHGDVVNLAFRLAGVAARGGMAPVLVSADVAAAAPTAANYGEPVELAIKGRVAPAVVLAAQA